MKIYLCSRYSRGPEMREYKARLVARGHEVTSRWIEGDHEWVNVPDETMPVEVGAKFAQEDIEDLMGADLLMCFTQAPEDGKRGRGGRHVEYGIALATNMDVIVIGPRENVFYCLPHIHHCESFDHALGILTEQFRG